MQLPLMIFTNDIHTINTSCCSSETEGQMLWTFYSYSPVICMPSEAQSGCLEVRINTQCVVATETFQSSNPV